MKSKKLIALVMAGLVSLFMFSGCGSGETSKETATETNKEASAETNKETTKVGKTDMSVSDQHGNEYQPQKKKYHIVATYKLIHSWYDAIKTGADTAIAELAEQGVEVEFDWQAPVVPDALDQVGRIEAAVAKNSDLIAVDITQEDTTTNAINAAVATGVPVMTFAGSDLPNSDRIAFVGNLKNYDDGFALAEALAEAINHEGQVAVLAGTIGAPSHEQRILGFRDALAQYPDIEIVDEQRDEDLVEKAIQITESWLQKYPDLKGILANNASNPVGAAQAVKDAGKTGKVLIAGMDHDIRTLNYLKEGVILAAQVQNCYDMGYLMIHHAIMVIDGVEPGPDTFDEVYGVGSTTVYSDEAQKYIDLLYPDK